MIFILPFEVIFFVSDTIGKSEPKFERNFRHRAKENGTADKRKQETRETEVRTDCGIQKTTQIDRFAEEAANAHRGCKVAAFHRRGVYESA